MRIDYAIEREHGLEVSLDGRRFFAGEKYTILELGYAVYNLRDDHTPEADQWILDNGDELVVEDGVELRSQRGMLVTSDPILVALAYEAWWRRNGEPPVPQGEPLPIPLFHEAVEIVRSRRILNWKGPKGGSAVPGLDRLPRNPRRRRRRNDE